MRLIEPTLQKWRRILSLAWPSLSPTTRGTWQRTGRGRGGRGGGGGGVGGGGGGGGGGPTTLWTAANVSSFPWPHTLLFSGMPPQLRSETSTAVRSRAARVA